MSDKLFITKDAFEQYRDVSEQLDDNRANASILEAQITDLIDFIGQPLYKVLQVAFTAPNTWTDPKYKDLFDGVSYTPANSSYEVIYHGLQPVLTYYAYARYLNNAQMNISRIGPVTYTETDTSDAAVQAQIKTKVIDARAMAVRYQEEALKFLQTNSADYPEWQNTHVQNKAFKFIKI